MERLRRSFRNSFRRKKPQQLESSKSHQFEADEQAVRNGSCSFPVKYLGCVQVEDSRGMHVCEQALVRLKTQRQKSIKGLLYVSGDGLRVVDDETKGLIVDQTIEKVSFCAPDRNLERGFSYICRDGTTRRWMCHGFLATKDTGERLSHAVGCAFTVCLERKQKRDTKLQETNNNSGSNSNATLTHSGNHTISNNHTSAVNTNNTSASISTISDSNASSINSVGLNSSVTSNSTNLPFQRTGSFRRVPMIQRIKDPQECKTIDPVPIKEVKNPYAIERPHATPQLLERQGSFRIFNSLNQSSPFKRQLSLRVHSTSNRLERQRNNSLQTPDAVFGRLSNGCTTNNNTHSAPQEANNKQETISAMCKELSQGLSLLTELHDSSSSNASNSITHNVSPLNASNNNHDSINSSDVASANKKFAQLSSYAEDFFKSLNTPILTPEPYRASPTLSMGSNATTNSLSASKSNTSTHSSVKQTDLDLFAGFEADFDKHFDPNGHPIITNDSPIKTLMNGSKSIDSITSNLNQSNLNNSFNKHPSTNGSSKPMSNGPSNDLFDPFDAEWVSLAGRHHNGDYVKNTNPFLMTNPAVKAFEIKM